MISVKKLLIFLITASLTLQSYGLSAVMALMDLKVGDQVPDFQVRTVDNKEVSLSSLRGKIVVLSFWKRDHDFSERTLADLEKIYQEYGDLGVTVLAFNADQALEQEITDIGTSYNLNYLLAPDREFEIYGRFGVVVLPTTLVIGPEGKLAYYRTIHNKGFYSQVLGNVRYLLGEITQAQLETELNRKQLAQMPEARKHAKRYFNLGRMLLGLNHRDKARKELEKAAQADPSFFEPHLLLARIYLEDGETRKAMAELEQALTLEPGSKEAKLLQGIAYANQGEDGLALTVLQGLVKNNPEPPSEAYYQIGKIYEKQNKISLAQEAYSKAKELALIPQ
jgi:peroxiredoxin